MEKILECYPFRFERPPVLLIEGFKAYDGFIGDEPGAPHKGIDYVWKRNGKFLPFDVFSVHGGEAFHGISKTWGVFIVVRKIVSENIRYDTIYSHLRFVDTVPSLPKNKKGKYVWPENVKKSRKGYPISPGHYLGRASITGRTNRISQLHFELHEVNLKTGERKKVDPYGLYLRASSGEYPQPGESLEELNHYWISNNPPFAI